MSDTLDKIKAIKKKVTSGRLKIQRKKIKDQVLKDVKPTDKSREEICKKAREKAHTVTANTKRDLSNEVRSNLHSLSEGYDFIEESCGTGDPTFTFFNEPQASESITEAFGTDNKYGMIGVAEGVFAPIGAMSRNNRIYDEDHYDYLLENEILVNKISSRGMLGTIGHYDKRVDDKDLAEGKVSHIVTDLHIQEEADGTRNLVGRLEILNTPAGNLLKTYYDSGMPLYVSSRGAGRLLNVANESYKRVDKTNYYLETFDIVKEPGFLQAKPNYVRESLEEPVQENDNNIIGENNMDNKKVVPAVDTKMEAEEIITKLLDPLKEQLAELTETVKILSDKVIDEEAETVEEVVAEEATEEVVEEAKAEEVTEEVVEEAKEEETAEEVVEEAKAEEQVEEVTEEAKEESTEEVVEEAKTEEAEEVVEACEDKKEDDKEDDKCDKEECDKCDESAEEVSEDACQEPKKETEDDEDEKKAPVAESAEEEVSEDACQEPKKETEDDEDEKKAPVAEAQEEVTEEVAEEVVEEAKEETAEEVVEACEDKEKPEAKEEAEDKEETKAEEDEDKEEKVEEAQTSVDYESKFKESESVMNELVKLVSESSARVKALAEKHDQTVKELNAYKLAEKLSITIDEAKEKLESKTFEEIVEEAKTEEVVEAEPVVEEKVEEPVVEAKKAIKPVFSRFANLNESKKSNKKGFSIFG